MAEIKSFGLILLAAGESRRMGRPKQLLPVGDRTLIRHAVDVALASGASPVIVVLGANAPGIRLCLEGLTVQIIVNEGWAEGMASSIRTGIEQLSLAPKTDGVMISLCDQPGLSARHLESLLKAHFKTGRGIIASQHGGKATSPAFFIPRYFSALSGLRGDAGARSLFSAYADDVATIESEDLSDLDTPDDYTAYLRQTGIDQL